MSNTDRVLLDGETVKQECIECGHTIESAVINAPIAFEAKAGDCEDWCAYVSKVNGDWLVSTQVVRNRVRPE